MLPYPDPSTLDPEMSFSPSQEVISPPTLNPYYYPMSSPPFSPSNFNYDFLFTATDALPGDALDASALPPPEPEAGREGATVAAPPATRKPGRRKRFRTDRHSKIHTSQGLRDRRMRLSLNVARQFFRLQDMLGFDKASHTIDWLLTQSKSAIELLAGSSRFSNKNNQLNSGGGSFVAESSASECEVVSSNSNHKPKPTVAASSKAKGTTTPRPPREVAFDPPIFTRESRDKARARARERTIEKKRIRSERPASDHTRQVDQLVTSKITNGEEEGVRVSGQVYGCSQMSMISPWFMYDNNEANELLDEQHKISFSGNKEVEGIFLG